MIITRRRALNLARAYYFFFFAAIGCFIPYANLYFEQMGLSRTEIGLLSSLLPLGLIIAGPIWGGLGDRFRLHRVLLPLASFGPIVPVLLMPWTTRFEWLLLLTAAMALTSTPIGALIDSATLELLEDNPRAYGGIRLGGTLGYSVSTLVMGTLTERFGLVWGFAGYALCMALAGVVALGLPSRRARLQTSFNAGLRDLTAQRPLMFFLAGSLLIGMAFQAAVVFYPLRLQALGASTALIGIASALAAVAELPVLVYSNAVLKRLGAWGSVTVGALTYAVRWTLVALASDPLFATLTQLTHTLSFALFLVGGVTYVDERTPPGLSATAQGVFNASMFGIGAALGTASGGWLYDQFGAPVLFLCAAAASLGGFVFIGAARVGERRPPVELRR